VAIAARRKPPRADDVGRCAVLHPAVAEAAHRLGADAVGLVDLGCSAGFNLVVDRVGIRYDDGQRRGDPTSPVQLSCSVVGKRPVPTRAIPEVVARIGVDRDPIDVTDADDARWVRACVPPDRRERSALVEAAIEVTAAAAPVLLRGDLVELLPEAVSRVPGRALPVVTTTWSLARLRPADRLRLVGSLEAAAGRPVAWVPVEGVGVAPGIPTFGDRPASGHSIIGLGMYDGASRRTEALGRCWSRGRLMSWTAA
jgi:hypothetical protein